MVYDWLRIELEIAQRIPLSLFIITAALANEETIEEETSKGKQPFINPELSPNVTGVFGKEIRLACHIEHLGNKTVTMDSQTSLGM